jgi:hypothetical protein
MRRSIGLAILGLETALLALFFLNVRLETGIDALQYHRMADSIVATGIAPWAINPLSYLGVYPGGDSSGVPFLVAGLAELCGTSVAGAVLAYDGMLLVAFGLGLFILIRELTDRSDLALAAILMGGLAYGFFTTISWSLDERSLNVALAPVFLFLVLPGDIRRSMRRPGPRYVILGFTCFILLVSHLSFLLLVPFLILVPMFHDFLRHRPFLRRRRIGSVVYFGAIGLAPLALLAALNQFGILADLGLQYQLESSALFSGSSPAVFLINAMVFLGTRVGPVNLVLGVFGVIYLGSRRFLPRQSVSIGAFLLSGFLGLPIVLYSKDLLTPIFVVLAAVALGSILIRVDRRRPFVLALSLVIVVSSSLAFDVWNLSRTSRNATLSYWVPNGVTPEAQAGNLWMSGESSAGDCVFGNNPIAVSQVSTGSRLLVCLGLPVDVLINDGSSPGSPPIHVVYVGFSAVNPSNWFVSPELTKVSNDFAQLPTLSYSSGRALLQEYHVSLVVVDREHPQSVPLFAYQGTSTSRFFTELWQNAFPLYETATIAIFGVGPGPG